MSLDTKCLPVLTTDENRDYEAKVQAARVDAGPQQKIIIDTYIKTEAPKLIKVSESRGGNLTLEDAAKTVLARCQGGQNRDLYRDDIIDLDHHGVMIVGDILKDFSKYDQATAADPQEPELGRGKAKLYFNKKEKKPCLHSFCHGGIKYFLHDVPAGTEIRKNDNSQNNTWDIEDALFHIQQIASRPNDDGGVLNNLKVLPVVEDILLNQNFSPMEMSAFRDECKTRLKIAKGALDTTVKQSSSNSGTDDDPLTHIEISDCFLEHLCLSHSSIVGAENALWMYGDNTDGLFKKNDIINAELKIGHKYSKENNCTKGSDYKAIARLTYNSVVDVSFFNDAPYGLPGANKFYQIIENNVVVQDYSEKLRARWKLDTDPTEFYRAEQAPLFQSYLNYALDEQQQRLLQEVVGALLTGCMSSLQKAALLIGSGDNGKSVLLDLLTHAFHKDLRCSIKPDKMSEDYFKAMLAGKIINIIGEIEDTKPIKSDFKDIVAADTPLTARLPYAPPFDFLPQAGHIFSTNAFPMTKDHTAGFYRRWTIIEFKNKVTSDVKIPRLGKKIAKNEMGQFLAWGLEGAHRLVKNNFKLTQTEQHIEMGAALLRQG